MSPGEVATCVIKWLFAKDHHLPQDWDLDNTKTIGEWKEAITGAVQLAQLSHQGELDTLEQGWRKYHADVLAHIDDQKDYD